MKKLNLFRFGDFEFEFSKRLEEINTQVDEKIIDTNTNDIIDNSASSPINILEQTDSKYNDDISKIYKVSPASAMLLSWEMLEQELLALVIRLELVPSNIVHSQQSVSRILDLLLDNKIIDLETHSILAELKAIRDAAVHQDPQKRYIMPIEDGIVYHQITKKAINLLKNANRNFTSKLEGV